MKKEARDPSHPDVKWFVRVENWHPATLNQTEGRHWSAKHKARSFDKDMVAVCCTATGVPDCPTGGKRRVGLTIVLGPRQRGADPDAYWKSLLDALVACRALRGDHKEAVELLPVAYERGRQRAAVIMIEEM